MSSIRNLGTRTERKLLRSHNGIAMPRGRMQKKATRKQIVTAASSTAAPVTRSWRELLKTPLVCSLDFPWNRVWRESEGRRSKNSRATWKQWKQKVYRNDGFQESAWCFFLCAKKETDATGSGRTDAAEWQLASRRTSPVGDADNGIFIEPLVWR